MFFCTECVVDWIKHAFITKFNKIPPSVYSEYSNHLCSKMIGKGRTGFLDSSHNISRAIGFVPFPLGCIVSFFIKV